MIINNPKPNIYYMKLYNNSFNALINKPINMNHNTIDIIIYKPYNNYHINHNDIYYIKSYNNLFETVVNTLINISHNNIDITNHMVYNDTKHINKYIYNVSIHILNIILSMNHSYNHITFGIIFVNQFGIPSNNPRYDNSIAPQPLNNHYIMFQYPSYLVFQSQSQ